MKFIVVNFGKNYSWQIYFGNSATTSLSMLDFIIGIGNFLPICQQSTRFFLIIIIAPTKFDKFLNM